MSEFTKIRDKLEAPFKAIIALFEGSTVYASLKADVEAAWAELKSVSENDLTTVVKTIGVAALGGLATGGESAAIAAGIAAAGPAFKAAEADITSKTTNTLVTNIVNTLAAATPAKA